MTASEAIAALTLLRTEQEAALFRWEKLAEKVDDVRRAKIRAQFDAKLTALALSMDALKPFADGEVQAALKNVRVMLGMNSGGGK